MFLPSVYFALCRRCSWTGMLREKKTTFITKPLNTYRERDRDEIWTQNLLILTDTGTRTTSTLSVPLSNPRDTFPFQFIPSSLHLCLQFSLSLPVSHSWLCVYTCASTCRCVVSSAWVWSGLHWHKWTKFLISPSVFGFLWRLHWNPVFDHKPTITRFHCPVLQRTDMMGWSANNWGYPLSPPLTTFRGGIYSACAEQANMAPLDHQ